MTLKVRTETTPVGRGRHPEGDQRDRSSDHGAVLETRVELGRVVRAAAAYHLTTRRRPVGIAGDRGDRRHGGSADLSAPQPDPVIDERNDQHSAGPADDPPHVRWTPPLRPRFANGPPSRPSEARTRAARAAGALPSECRSEERTRFSSRAERRRSRHERPSERDTDQLGEAPVKYELTGASGACALGRNPPRWRETVLLPLGPHSARGNFRRFLVIGVSPGFNGVSGSWTAEACRSGFRGPIRRRLEGHVLQPCRV